MTAGKEKESEVQLEARAHGGFLKPQHNPESIRDTTGTAGAFGLCSARPYGISLVEGSTNCLLDAQYVSCRGRDRSP